MPVDPTIAYRRVRQFSGSGPAITPAKARAVAIGLRRCAAQAPDVVADVMELDSLRDEVAATPVSVLARPGWAQAAAISAAPLIDGLTSGRRINDRVVSEELAAGLALIAPRILGQYDPFALTAVESRGLPVPGRLLLIAPNIWQFATEWNLDSRDLQLFVCVHEFTHAFQFTAAPWLKDVMIAKVRIALEGADDGLQSSALDDLLAVMAVLEGHADYVMNTVPIARIPSRKRITAAIRARRTSGSTLTKIAGRALGMDLKLNQYAQGEQFVSAIIGAAGHDGMNVLWQNPAHLPTPAELKDPSSWITRVLS